MENFGIVLELFGILLAIIACRAELNRIATALEKKNAER